MALRTFRFNPSLGGFGRESSSSSHIQSFSRQSKNNENNTRTTNNDLEEEVVVEADAFAQIIKELVDNAMDACRSCQPLQEDTSVQNHGTTVSKQKAKHPCGSKHSAQANEIIRKSGIGATTKDRSFSQSHISRRVLVKIVPEPATPRIKKDDSPSHDKSAEGDSDPSAGLPHQPPRELVRVTVTDNGCGMKDIQACVDPFFTNKAHNSSSTTTTATKEAATMKNKTKTKTAKDIHDHGNSSHQNNTAGRYGIGLTLCLLHAQRLVPHSSASIQSATAQDSHYTQVQCWVDTDCDAVRCWPVVKDNDKAKNGTAPAAATLLPKRFASQSGTSISLLLPGGATAAAAWPRLASYFSKFQLSLDLPCSLQVMAPSLSHIPLYVQPVHEEEAAAADQRRNKSLGLKDSDNESSCSKPSHHPHSPSTESGKNPSSKRSTRRVSTSPIQQQPKDDEGNEDWIDPMDLPLGDDQPKLPSSHCHLHDEVEEFKDWVDPMSMPLEEDLPFLLPSGTKEPEDLSTGHRSDSSCSIFNKWKKKSLTVSPQDLIRSRLHRAAQKYLGREVDLKNVAHATVPIRQPAPPYATATAAAVQPFNEWPQLEIGFIVYNHHADDSDDVPENRPDQNAASAEMTLIRLVNSVPLLDSAQAVACGLVQGLLEMQKVWHTFGLTVTPHPGRRRGSTCLPTFQVKDSDQVAPFFQQHHTHKQHRQDDATSFVSEEDDEEEEENQSAGSNEDRDAVSKSKRRRRKQRRAVSHGSDWLRPAHSRLGNLLVICQLHANPSRLPLPTLCKGRLPLDDAGLLTALQVAITRCLRQLQTSNPTLFLTTKQLKTVERNVQFVPALAQAVTSIVTNSTSKHPVVDRYLEKIRRGSDEEDTSNDTTTFSLLQSLVEERLRRNISQNAENKLKQKRKAKKKANAADSSKDKPSETTPVADDWNGYQEYNDETFQTSQESPNSKPKIRQNKSLSRKQKTRNKPGRRKGKVPRKVIGELESRASDDSPTEEDGSYQEYSEHLFQTDRSQKRGALDETKAIIAKDSPRKMARESKGRSASQASSNAHEEEEDYREYTEDLFGTNPELQPVASTRTKAKRARASSRRKASCRGSNGQKRKNNKTTKFNTSSDSLTREEDYQECTELFGLVDASVVDTTNTQEQVDVAEEEYFSDASFFFK
ncbi:hypothetical protein ACA910_018015 [Epithemia clementina (nom. ined.)]